MPFEVNHYIKCLHEMLDRLDIEKISQLGERLLEIWRHDGALYVAGNGGSAATASHFVCDIVKMTINPKHPRFKAVSLASNIPLITAWGNDSSFDDIFAQQGAGLIKSGDMLLCISTSGNSPNILKLAAEGRKNGAFTAALTGFYGGRLKKNVDLAVNVPSSSIQIIEDLHLAICHMIVLMTCSKAGVGVRQLE